MIEAHLKKLPLFTFLSVLCQVIRVLTQNPALRISLNKNEEYILAGETRKIEFTQEIYLH